jgi:hypothetical protein
MTKRCPDQDYIPPVVIGPSSHLYCPFAYNQVYTGPDYCWKSLSPYATPEAVRDYPPFKKLPPNHELFSVYNNMRYSHQHGGYMMSKM